MKLLDLSPARAARVAGAAYLVIIVAGLFAELFARGRVFEASVDAAVEDAAREAGTVVATIPGAEGTIVRVVAERSSLPAGADWQEVDPSLEDAYLAEVGEEALAEDDLVQAAGGAA